MMTAAALRCRRLQSSRVGLANGAKYCSRYVRLELCRCSSFVILCSHSSPVLAIVRICSLCLQLKVRLEDCVRLAGQLHASMSSAPGCDLVPVCRSESLGSRS